MINILDISEFFLFDIFDRFFCPGEEKYRIFGHKDHNRDNIAIELMKKNNLICSVPEIQVEVRIVHNIHIETRGYVLTLVDKKINWIERKMFAVVMFGGRQYYFDRLNCSIPSLAEFSQVPYFVKGVQTSEKWNAAFAPQLKQEMGKILKNSSFQK